MPWHISWSIGLHSWDNSMVLSLEGDGLEVLLGAWRALDGEDTVLELLAIGKGSDKVFVASPVNPPSLSPSGMVGKNEFLELAKLLACPVASLGVALPTCSNIRLKADITLIWCLRRIWEVSYPQELVKMLQGSAWLLVSQPQAVLHEKSVLGVSYWLQNCRRRLRPVRLQAAGCHQHGCGRAQPCLRKEQLKVCSLLRIIYHHRHRLQAFYHKFFLFLFLFLLLFLFLFLFLFLVNWMYFGLDGGQSTEHGNFIEWPSFGLHPQLGGVPPPTISGRHWELSTHHLRKSPACYPENPKRTSTKTLSSQFEQSQAVYRLPTTVCACHRAVCLCQARFPGFHLGQCQHPSFLFTHAFCWRLDEGPIKLCLQVRALSTCS